MKVLSNFAEGAFYLFMGGLFLVGLGVAIDAFVRWVQR